MPVMKLLISDARKTAAGDMRHFPRKVNPARRSCHALCLFFVNVFSSV